jgi:hypothetical protein
MGTKFTKAVISVLISPASPARGTEAGEITTYKEDAMMASPRSAGSPKKKRAKQAETSPLLYAAVMIDLGGVDLPDPYLTTMKSDKFELTHVTHRKGTELDVIDWRTAHFAALSPKKYTLPRNWTEMTLTSSGGRIGSTDLSEIFAQKYAVDHAHGDVLICGLGIGFMLHSLKANTKVKSITCVEPENDLINLLSGYFPHVVFVNEDPRPYVEDRKNARKYDFVYFNAEGDSIGYFYSDVAPFRAKAKKVLRSKTSRNDIVCWMEDVMRGQIIKNIMGGIGSGFDIRTLSSKKVTNRQGFEPIVMDFFAEFGVVTADDQTLAKVTQFVWEWEMK